VGGAIAQAVSHWLPTAAVRGSKSGRHVGFCGGQSGAGAGFLPKFIPPIALKNHLHHHHHHHQSIIEDMYNRPNVQTSMAAVQGPNRHLGT
jgi:hypothetical protein